MPNIKSAKKRVKVGHRNNERAVSMKSAFRTAIRVVRDLATEGKAEEAMAKLPTAFSRIDKAVKRKIIHKNAAARLKERLVKKIKAIKA